VTSKRIAVDQLDAVGESRLADVLGRDLDHLRSISTA
jgi:hypothetical protein